MRCQKEPTNPVRGHRESRVRTQDSAPKVESGVGCAVQPVFPQSSARMDAEHMPRVPRISPGSAEERSRLVWDRDLELPPEVNTAVTLIRVLASRIGAVPHGGVLPGAIRRQRWSALNVPLMWAAASQEESCPLMEWLISATSTMSEPVHFHGGDLAPSVAVRVGWIALRQVMRSWGVESELELSTWLGNHGFPATRPGIHLNGRAQEYILNAGCREDARVALLECVFVALTLEEGRHRPRDPPAGSGSPGVRMRRTGVPMEVPSGSWAQMDRIDLEENS